MEGHTKRLRRLPEDCRSTCQLLRTRTDLPVSSRGKVQIDLFFFFSPLRIYDHQIEL